MRTVFYLSPADCLLCGLPYYNECEKTYSTSSRWLRPMLSASEPITASRLTDGLITVTGCNEGVKSIRRGPGWFSLNLTN